MAACSEAPDSGPAAVAGVATVAAFGTAKAAGAAAEAPAARENAGQAIAGNRQSAARKMRAFSMGGAVEMWLQPPAKNAARVFATLSRFGFQFKKRAFRPYTGRLLRFRLHYALIGK